MSLKIWSGICLEGQNYPRRITPDIPYQDNHEEQRYVPSSDLLSELQTMSLTAGL